MGFFQIQCQALYIADYEFVSYQRALNTRVVNFFLLQLKELSTVTFLYRFGEMVPNSDCLTSKIFCIAHDIYFAIK